MSVMVLWLDISGPKLLGQCGRIQSLVPRLISSFCMQSASFGLLIYELSTGYKNVYVVNYKSFYTFISDRLMCFSIMLCRRKTETVNELGCKKVSRVQYTVHSFIERPVHISFEQVKPVVDG